ncbi:MAG: heavy-metal-associated domain-containing protein [Tannerella sp.]|jgi:copper chaperone CopZ|nr:heavy-metal-associated domain-containing protein [Tannerella sp.]
MRTKLLIFAVVLSCAIASNAQENKDEQKKKRVDITFSVNMYCDNCKARIEKALIWEKSVKDLEVKLKEKTVRVVFDPRKTTAEKFQNLIKDLGYTCEISDLDKAKRKTQNP